MRTVKGGLTRSTLMEECSALREQNEQLRAEVERLREKLAGYEGLGRSVPRIRQALSPTEEPR